MRRPLGSRRRGREGCSRCTGQYRCQLTVKWVFAKALCCVGYASHGDACGASFFNSCVRATLGYMESDAYSCLTIGWFNASLPIVGELVYSWVYVPGDAPRGGVGAKDSRKRSITSFACNQHIHTWMVRPGTTVTLCECM